MFPGAVIQKFSFHRIKLLGITNRAGKLAVGSYKRHDTVRWRALGSLACGEAKQSSSS